MHYLFEMVNVFRTDLLHCVWGRCQGRTNDGYVVRGRTHPYFKEFYHAKDE